MNTAEKPQVPFPVIMKSLLAYHSTKGAVALNPELKLDVDSSNLKGIDQDGNVVEYSIPELIEMRNAYIQKVVDLGGESILRKAFMKHLHAQLVIALAHKVENSTELTGHVISIS